MSPALPTDDAKPGIRRKLAALFAADVAGYSRLMAADEEGTTRRLREHRAIMDALIAHHGGRIANTAGDSVLAEFGSSVEAVRCAVEVQEALKSRNDALPEDLRLEFRIGVNVGDVIEQGEDLLGDGINIAARLESVAAPGGICISGEVRDQIDGKLTLQCVSMGQQRLKNIRRPIKVFRVAGDGKGRAGTVTRVLSGTHTRGSLVVAAAVVVMALGALWIAWERWWSGPPPQTALDPATDRASVDQGAIDSVARQSVKAHPILARGSFGGHEYVLVGTWGTKWVEAEAEARAMGGHLVTISSPEEDRFVVDMIRNEDAVWRLRDEGDRWQRYGPWIGLVQMEGAEEPAGGWVWSNGEPLTYTNWFWHQPDNYGGIEEFGRYREFSNQPGIKWDDARRNATAKGYIVEFSAGRQ